MTNIALGPRLVLYLPLHISVYVIYVSMCGYLSAVCIMCVCIYVCCLYMFIYHIWLNVRIHMCVCTIVHCFLLWGMYMRERLLSLQYKEAYDRELMQHSNTMQELVLVKQRLESEQESLAEAYEAVRVAEAKLAENDVSNKCECVYVHVYTHRIRQNFRVGKLSQLCTQYTIHWKTFAVHQAVAIMHCTQQVIQG